MTIRKLEVTLETVTPLFLGGADGQPELRPPSIRGQLRYWLRAALGAMVGDDLVALKQAESEVFGSPDGTGAVGIRTSQPRLSVLEKVNPLPHKKDTPTRFAGFDAGQRVEIWLTQRSPNENTWLAAVSALLLMVSFGGLGRRCRRGWGTLRIVETDTSQAGLNEGWREVLAHRPNSTKAWWNYLDFSLLAAQEGIKPLWKQLKIKPNQPVKSSTYTIASPRLVQPVVVTKPYNTYTEAISAFGESEHDWLKSNPNLTDCVGFAKPQDRQASPLWLRVFPVRAGDGTTRYILVAALFNVSFKGANYRAVSEFLKTANFEVPK